MQLGEKLFSIMPPVGVSAVQIDILTKITYDQITIDHHDIQKTIEETFGDNKKFELNYFPSLEYGATLTKKHIVMKRYEDIKIVIGYF